MGADLTTGTDMTGYDSSRTCQITGSHYSYLAITTDPRVDSGCGKLIKSSYGFAHNTAGPNSLDLVKKAHPHVGINRGKLAKTAECPLKLTLSN